MNITLEITLDVPVAEAFAYYLDEASLPGWVCGGRMLEFTPLTAPPKRVGSRYRMVYRLLGVTLHSITEVTALEPGRRSAKDQVSGDYKVWHYEMLFAPVSPGKTHMECTRTAGCRGGSWACWPAGWGGRLFSGIGGRRWSASKSRWRGVYARRSANQRTFLRRKRFSDQ